LDEELKRPEHASKCRCDHLMINAIWLAITVKDPAWRDLARGFWIASPLPWIIGAMRTTREEAEMDYIF